jgi:hypothetical protein
MQIIESFTVCNYQSQCKVLIDILRLQVREDEKHAVCVHGITEHEVNSVDSLVEVSIYSLVCK